MPYMPVHTKREEKKCLKRYDLHLHIFDFSTVSLFDEMNNLVQRGVDEPFFITGHAKPYLGALPEILIAYFSN
jgi:hypothetical protein